jgi:16S rRNA (cytosine967-C5)-methyltransferase
MDGLEWPSDGIRLRYPDWLIERLTSDLGPEPALEMLEVMNRAPSVHERDDGYIQDEASQWVAAAVGAQPGERILDLCAAPGGKATALAATGASIVAADARPSRARLVATNVSRLELDNVGVVAADGTAPAFASRSFDRVLVDAPCSGLGVLRRRADARWRITPGDIDELAVLQERLLDAAVGLVRPGGRLVYSVCTVTTAETLGVAEAVQTRHGLTPEPVSDERWETLGRGFRLLPQAHDTDGMAIFVWKVD